MQQAARAARARAADAEAARSAAPNPAPAATSPATAVDPAAATLQSVVAEYAAALGSYDVERLRRIYPNLTLRQEEGMRRLWRRARDLRVTLRLANLTHQGQTAEGQVEGEYAYTSPATHVIEHQPVFHRVAFQQKGSAWVLTAIE